MGLLRTLRKGISNLISPKPPRGPADDTRNPRVEDLQLGPKREELEEQVQPIENTRPQEEEDLIREDIPIEVKSTFTRYRPTRVAAAVIKKLAEAIDPNQRPIDGYRQVHANYDVYFYGLSVAEVRDVFDYIVDQQLVIKNEVLNYLQKSKIRVSGDGQLSLRLCYGPEQTEKIKVYDGCKRDHLSVTKTNYVTVKNPSDDKSEDATEAPIPIYFIKIPIKVRPRTVTEPESSAIEQVPRIIIRRNKRIEFDTELVEGTILIGRSSLCDLPINHQTISDLHLMITLANNRLYVEDCNSLNGSYLESPETGEILPIRCGELRELRRGDRILLNSPEPDTEPTISFEGLW